MAVLIREITTSGKRRQCNSRCHDAKLPSCTCICGGRYHGGARADDLSARVDKFFDEILKEAEERKPKVIMQRPLPLFLSKEGVNAK